MLENFFKNKIDKANSGNFDVGEEKITDKEKEEKSQKQESLEELIKQKTTEAEKFVENNNENLAIFTGDASLKYIPSDGFSYLPEKDEIHLDLKWFIEKGYSQEEILWALYHEGSHFRDKRKNPEVFLENFEYCQKKGKEIASQLEKKYKDAFEKTHPEIIERFTKQMPIDKNDSSKGTMNSLEVVGYKKLARFYNILDDMYVNDIVRNRAPKYGTENGKNITQGLYKKLFPSNDFEKLPRHLSFDALLRGEMVKDEENKLHSDAQKAFEEYSFLFREALKNLHYQKHGQVDPEERYELIKKTLEPIYLDLLKKDIEEWQPQLPKQQENNQGKEKQGQGKQGEQGNQGEQGGQEGKPSEGNFNPDPFAEQTSQLPGHENEQPSGSSKNKPDRNQQPGIDKSIKDIKDTLDKLKKFKEKKDEEKRKKGMSPEERAKYNREKDEERLDKEFDVTLEERKLYNQRKKEVEPYLKEMLEFFKSIVYGKEREQQKETYPSNRGKFNTDIYIKNKARNEEFLRSGRGREMVAFEKTRIKEIPTNQPELIKIRVVGDISSSMMFGDRMKILQQTILLLLNSIESFNKYLDTARSQTKSCLRADSEAWVYNNDAQRVKEFTEEKKKTYRQKEADIIKVFSNLKAYGGNDEYVAFKKIEDTLNNNDIKNIKDKKVLEIVFFITDGGIGLDGSHNIIDIQKQVEELDKKGIITIGFQIGSDSQSEKDIFNSVFNDSNKLKHTQGNFIGSDVKKLPQEAIKSLRDILKNIRI